MRIQEALSNCGSTMKTMGASVVQWCGRMVNIIKDFLVAFAQKASAMFQKGMAWAGPQLDKAKDFASENRAYIIVAAVSIVLTAIIAKLCCSKSNPAPAPRQPAPQRA